MRPARALIHVECVNQPEVVNVERDLGVMDFAQRLDDLLGAGLGFVELPGKGNDLQRSLRFLPGYELLPVLIRRLLLS